MVLIQTSSIEKKDNLSVYNLNYPIITVINKKISTYRFIKKNCKEVKNDRSTKRKLKYK